MYALRVLCGGANLLEKLSTLHCVHKLNTFLTAKVQPKAHMKTKSSFYSLVDKDKTKCHAPLSHVDTTDRMYFPTDWCIHAGENTKSFDIISARVNRLDTSDEQVLIQDYLHCAVKDSLDKNDEVYVCEGEICTSPGILQLLGGATPNFIVKKNKSHRTTLIAICGCDKAATNVKHKFGAMSFFANVFVVSPKSLSRRFGPPLPAEDTEFISKSCARLLEELVFWKERKASRNVSINCLGGKVPQPPEAILARLHFRVALHEYLESVAGQDGI